MKFYITFNRKSDDYTLSKLGATIECYEWGCQYEINIDSLDDIEDLETKILELVGSNYFLILSVKDKTIYIDEEV